MTRQRYSIQESFNRILRLFQGETVNEIPGTLPPEVLSEDEAMSDLAELLNSSLPGETLTLPISVKTAVTNAGFASGTASSLILVSGTTQFLIGATVLVFESGLNVEITGTTAFINTV
jgi:hypothetical protein